MYSKGNKNNITNIVVYRSVQPLLSLTVLCFHGFPSSEELRKRWVVNVRQEHYTLTSHTKVCGRHFTGNRLISAKSWSGKRRLLKGALPQLFKCNDYTLPPPRSSVWDRESCLETEDIHDVESMNGDGERSDSEPAAALDMALIKNNILAEESLKREMEAEASFNFLIQTIIWRGYLVLHVLQWDT